jgi:uncharacterized integral membrane protein (TIGR00698 family)
MLQWLSPRWPGFCVCAIVAITARFVSEHYGAPVMLMALLLGMALNFLSIDGACKTGIDLTAKEVLRIGVALLGLRITLEQVTALGWQPVLVVVAAITFTIVLGIVLAWWMDYRIFFGLLTGGAVGICGASAALALSAAMPHHPLKEKATLFTVIGVSALSTLAMVLYPALTQGLGLSEQQAGFFIGATIHDVAQVVGAGYSISKDAGDMATLVKLVRVAMLLPVIVLVGWVSVRHGTREEDGAASTARPPLLPGFAVAFAFLMVINSTHWLSLGIVQAGQGLSQWCLIAAMVAIGMKTHLKNLIDVGWQPIALMLIETLGLAAFVYATLHS